MFPGPEIALVGAGLGVGFVGSLHCVGMCGPFAVLAGADRGWRGVVTYSLGRLATYALLGAFAGLFGAALAQLRTVGLVVAVVVVLVVSLQLAGVLPEPRFAARWAAPVVRAVRGGRATSRLALGAATALLPCGLVYAGLGVAVTSGSPLVGGLVMVAFGLGTWPALVAFGAGAGRLFSLGPRARQAMAVAVAVAGLWAVGHRAGAVDGAADSGEVVPECCQGAHPSQH